MKKRVKIPHQNPKALLDLATNMRAKHLADGEASPLRVMNWTELNPMIDDALAIEDRALQLNREKLLTYQQRRIQLKKIERAMRNTRDILTAVHSDEMKMLGLWGYDVLENRTSSPDVSVPEAAD